MNSKVRINGKEIIIFIDDNWKQLYQRQVECISTWLDNDVAIDYKYKNPNKDDIKESILFDDYLRGKNVAGIGQGRFTNNAKREVRENWEEIKELLKKVSSPTNTDFVACKGLQDKLVSLCVKDRKPWAAIHAMIVALRPSDFCTIVSENNLNELYKNLNDLNGQVEDSKKDPWDNLKNSWEEAKKHEKDNMSWYYKSAAINNYYRSLLQTTDNAWKYKNYPWATLVALRGEENIKELCNKLERQKNIILTGAPGTGKTYLARKIAAKLINVDEIEKLNNLKSATNSHAD